MIDGRDDMVDDGVVEFLLSGDGLDQLIDAFDIRDAGINRTGRRGRALQ